MTDDADSPPASNVVPFPASPPKTARVVAIYTLTLTITAGTDHLIELFPKPPDDAAIRQAANLFRSGIDKWAGPAEWPEPEQDPGAGFTYADAGATAPAFTRPPPRPRRTRRKQAGLPLDPPPPEK